MPKKWLILSNYPSEKGGLQSRTREICKELLRRKFEIEIWNFAADHFSDLADSSEDQIKIRFFSCPTRAFNLASIKYAYSQLKKISPDVLFFCIPGTPDFLSFIFAGRLTGVRNIVMHVGANPNPGIPYPVNIFNLIKGFGRWWWRFYFSCWLSMQCVTLSLFNNEDQLKRFTRLFGLYFAKKQLWWPPIDLSSFRPDLNIRESYRKRLGLDGYFVYGTVGRLCSQKNIDLIIKAFNEVRKKVKSKLIIVGSGDLYSQLVKLAFSLSLDKDVVFLGQRSDIPQILNAFDVFVFASGELNETLGIAVLEAMACGLPCIVSDLPGPKRIVGEDEYGLLFKSGDKFDLAHKMLRLYYDDDLQIKYKNLSLERAQYCERKRVVDFLLGLLA